LKTPAPEAVGPRTTPTVTLHRVASTDINGLKIRTVEDPF
jgi:hypothetical protein